MGGAIVERTSNSFPLKTIAELKEIYVEYVPASKKQQASVVEYTADTGVGGGDFYLTDADDIVSKFGSFSAASPFIDGLVFEANDGLATAYSGSKKWWLRVDWLSKPLSVHDFGAVGDFNPDAAIGSSTDNYQAIQNTLDTCLGITTRPPKEGVQPSRDKNRGKVCVPAGSYLCSETIRIPYGVILEGEGMLATEIRAYPSNNNTVVESYNYDNATNFIITEINGFDTKHGAIDIAFDGAAYTNASTNMTSGSPTITLTADALREGRGFQQFMVGATVEVVGAGSGGATLITTIQSVTSSTVATLATNALTTVTGARSYWGNTSSSARGVDFKSKGYIFDRVVSKFSCGENWYFHDHSLSTAQDQFGDTPECAVGTIWGFFSTKEAGLVYQGTNDNTFGNVHMVSSAKQNILVSGGGSEWDRIHCYSAGEGYASWETDTDGKCRVGILVAETSGNNAPSVLIRGNKGQYNQVYAYQSRGTNIMQIAGDANTFGTVRFRADSNENQVGLLVSGSNNTVLNLLQDGDTKVGAGVRVTSGNNQILNIKLLNAKLGAWVDCAFYSYTIRITGQLAGCDYGFVYDRSTNDADLLDIDLAVTEQTGYLSYCATGDGQAYIDSSTALTVVDIENPPTNFERDGSSYKFRVRTGTSFPFTSTLLERSTDQFVSRVSTDLINSPDLSGSGSVAGSSTQDIVDVGNIEGVWHIDFTSTNQSRYAHAIVAAVNGAWTVTPIGGAGASITTSGNIIQGSNDVGSGAFFEWSGLRVR